MDEPTSRFSSPSDIQSKHFVSSRSIDDNDSLEPEDEEKLRLRLLENDVKFPVAVFFLTFIFPPLGFIMFFLNKSLNRASLRYKWFNRALILGSALSVIYTYILCSLLHHYVLFSDTDDVLGYSYGTET